MTLCVVKTNLSPAKNKEMTPEQKKALFKKIWNERNPYPEFNLDTGEDMFWDTALMAVEDYIKATQPTPSPDVEAMAFGKWILEQNDLQLIDMVDGAFYWKDDKDGDQPMYEDDLYKQFKAGQASQPQDAAQEQEELYDLSDIPEVEKDKLVKGFVEAAAYNTLKLFLSLGLKNHIESMVINESTGKEYIFSFRTVENWKTTREMEYQLSAAQEEIKRLREAMQDILIEPSDLINKVRAALKTKEGSHEL